MSWLLEGLKYVHAKLLQSCLTLCDPMDCSLPGSSACGFSRQEYTGVGCRSLLQKIFLTQESNWSLVRLLHFRWILYCWATWGGLEGLNWNQKFAFQEHWPDRHRGMGFVWGMEGTLSGIQAPVWKLNSDLSSVLRIASLLWLPIWLPDPWYIAYSNKTNFLKFKLLYFEMIVDSPAVVRTNIVVFF